MEIFDKNDEGYILWLNQNPKGVVVNAHNPPTASYLVAHRASCHTINGTPTRGKACTVKYIKACGKSLGEVTKWTMENFNQKPHCCHTCSPD